MNQHHQLHNTIPPCHGCQYIWLNMSSLVQWKLWLHHTWGVISCIGGEALSEIQFHTTGFVSCCNLIILLWNYFSWFPWFKEKVAKSDLILPLYYLLTRWFCKEFWRFIEIIAMLKSSKESWLSRLVSKLPRDTSQVWNYYFPHAKVKGSQTNGIYFKINK